MIFLTTGRPGSGKTLLTIKQVIEFRDTFRDSDGNHTRNVYYLNQIKFNVDHPLYELVSDWISLTSDQIMSISIPAKDVLAGRLELSDLDFFEKGSIIVIDECHYLYPATAGNVAVPDYVKFLSLHRHSGLDFFLITQAESKIVKVVRGDVQVHRHLTRISGTNQTAYALSEEGLLSSCAEETKQGGRVFLDKKYFGLYDSAVQHTDKRTFLQFLASLPTKLKVLFFGIVFFLFLGFYMVSSSPLFSSLFGIESDSSEVSSEVFSEVSSGVLDSSSGSVSSDLPELYSFPAEVSPVIRIISTVYGSGQSFSLFSVNYEEASFVFTFEMLLEAGFDVYKVSPVVYIYNGSIIMPNVPLSSASSSDSDR